MPSLTTIEIVPRPLAITHPKGPSSFEIQYLKQLHDEIEILLRTSGFSTIRAVSIHIQGDKYSGTLTIPRSSNIN